MVLQLPTNFTRPPIYNILSKMCILQVTMEKAEDDRKKVFMADHEKKKTKPLMSGPEDK